LNRKNERISHRLAIPSIRPVSPLQFVRDDRAQLGDLSQRIMDESPLIKSKPRLDALPDCHGSFFGHGQIAGARLPLGVSLSITMAVTVWSTSASIQIAFKLCELRSLCVERIRFDRGVAA